MSKDKKYYGIDISSLVFDVIDSDNKFYQFPNNKKGFNQFFKLLNADSICVMEATGYYHYQLAYYLLENNILTSIVNPLSVKRFIQMRLSKVKTDKSDAKMICLYAQTIELKFWKGNTNNQRESLQLCRSIEFYTKQLTALKNKINSEKVLGTPCKLVVSSLKKSLAILQNEKKKLEEKLVELVRIDNKDLLTRLETIPGLGRKTAVMLIVLTDGFNRFEKASELCSYAGLTPIIRQSGSSVRGKPRISKMGNSTIRKLLFMCSLSSYRHNKACKEIFDRIVAKGKNKKLALIAVCNKILKQAFAIAKSGLIYDENYRSVLLEKSLN